MFLAFRNQFLKQSDLRVMLIEKQSPDSIEIRVAIQPNRRKLKVGHLRIHLGRHPAACDSYNAIDTAHGEKFSKSRLAGVQIDKYRLQHKGISHLGKGD